MKYSSFIFSFYFLQTNPVKSFLPFLSDIWQIHLHWTRSVIWSSSCWAHLELQSHVAFILCSSLPLGRRCWPAVLAAGCLGCHACSPGWYVENLEMMWRERDQMSFLWTDGGAILFWTLLFFWWILLGWRYFLWGQLRNALFFDGTPGWVLCTVFWGPPHCLVESRLLLPPLMAHPYLPAAGFSFPSSQPGLRPLVLGWMTHTHVTSVGLTGPMGLLLILTQMTVWEFKTKGHISDMTSLSVLSSNSQN